jgi:hypothetical protein
MGHGSHSPGGQSWERPPHAPTSHGAKHRGSCLRRTAVHIGIKTLTTYLKHYPLWLERYLHPQGWTCPHYGSSARCLFRAQEHFPA